LALALAPIVVVQDVSDTRPPVPADPHPHVRVGLDVLHVGGPSAMLCHDPERVSGEGLSHRYLARLTALAPAGLEDHDQR